MVAAPVVNKSNCCLARICTFIGMSKLCGLMLVSFLADLGSNGF